MEKINQLFQAGMKKVAVPAAIAVPALVVSGGARADAAAIKAAIEGAIASGTVNYELVVTGVITAAAFGFCVGMIVMWLRK